MWQRIRNLFSSGPSGDVLERVEETLYSSDVGAQTVQFLLEDLKVEGKDLQSQLRSVEEALKKKMLQILKEIPPPQFEEQNPPIVWMIVGVNGAGKTTSIGKLAHGMAGEGKKVLVAAGDTFRAAAAEQLRVWSQRAQVQIFSPSHTKDPAAVAYEAVQLAQRDQLDLVIVDTAGRLHTQAHLMEELKKVKRSIAKAQASAPHRTLLVLDANSGQNALLQAQQFHAALEVTGVILTKLDGSAKGGVALGLAHQLRLPVIWVGEGEGLSDLKKFSAEDYVNSLFADVNH